MTTTIKAHFDGKVLILDEPVDLPLNQPLNLSIQPTEAEIEAARAALDEQLRQEYLALGSDDDDDDWVEATSRRAAPNWDGD